MVPRHSVRHQPRFAVKVFIKMWSTFRSANFTWNTKTFGMGLSLIQWVEPLEKKTDIPLGRKEYASNPPSDSSCHFRSPGFQLARLCGGLQTSQLHCFMNQFLQLNQSLSLSHTVNVCIYVHTYIHMYIHTYMHTYIHIHTSVTCNVHICTHIYTERVRKKGREILRNRLIHIHTFYWSSSLEKPN